MKELILLEFNEVMIPYVEQYVRKGQLPNFGTLLAQYGYRVTDSERTYEHLEPWIQWVSAHTGLAYEQHKVFRLGDIAGTPVRQIFEVLEERGVSVGAVSPMNAENRLRNAAFFVPDPWTAGAVSADADVQRLFRAVANAVNENASSGLSLRDALALVEGLLRHGSVANWPKYVHLALGSIGRPWRRALFLDLMLADLFLDLWGRKKPGFGLLFLNAAAHVQHHYLYSSGSYEGPHRNPAWYVARGLDPLLEVYKVYDAILGRLLELRPRPRLLIATGLSQEPYPAPIYYYRLRDHRTFLELLGVAFQDVAPRMSRDFLVTCRDVAEASSAQCTIDAVRDPAGENIFETDNRGASLFVTLVYPKEVAKGMRLSFPGGELPDFSRHVAFVALKNGHHIPQGYFVDTNERVSSRDSVPVTRIYSEVVQHFSS
jgi:hypothetical protein